MKTAVSLTLKQRLQLNKQQIENKNQRDHVRQQLSHPKNISEKNCTYNKYSQTIQKIIKRQNPKPKTSNHG